MTTVTKTKRQSLNRYAGKWVALLNEKVIAQHDSLKGLLKIVESRGLREQVVFFLVPRKDEGPYVLVL